MIFPPYLPDRDSNDLQQDSVKGTTMFGNHYVPAASMNPYNIPLPVDGNSVCDTSKVTGQFCVPGQGCIQGEITNPVFQKYMFFRYGDLATCKPAYDQGLCAAPR